MKRILGTWLALLSLAACGGESTADGSSGSGGGSGNGGSVGAGATGGGSSGSGGASGSGGSGGVAGDGGGAPNQCTSDAECRLFSDCCTCAALGPNDPDPPSCLAACLQDSCSALGVSGAMCSGGSCVAGYECNHQKVLCESLPPVCEGGYTPSVIGSCWGPCVPTSECISVTSCADCTSPQEACVRIDQQTGPSVKCVPIPQGCGGSLCECMGDSVCSAPYDTCTDLSGIKGLTCSCPNC